MSRRPARNEDLHGNAPDRSRAALLIIDMINDLDFPENEHLLDQSAVLGGNIARLKARCGAIGIPTIYVNDNWGKWRSDFHEVLKHCTDTRSPGCAMVRQVAPQAEDYFVLKPKHSGFYATPLDTLLRYIGVETVILTGISANSCIMLTASDAYVRDLELFVPADCVAGQSDEEQARALDFMKDNFGVKTMPSDEIDLEKLLSAAEEEEPEAITR